MILGDANEYFVLKQAKVEKADMVLSLTDDDNLNIMLSQICQKIYHIPIVIARVNHPKYEAIFNRLGIKTICPNTLAVKKLIELME